MCNFLKSKNPCCCDIKFGCILIGVLGIVVHLVCIILSCITLSRTEHFRYVSGSLLLIISIPGLIFACLLLYATANSDAILCYAALTGYCVMCYLTAAYILYHIGNSGLENSIIALAAIIAVLIYAYFVWVIYAFTIRLGGG